MLVQTSPALAGHAFPRLKLRYKPSLVQVGQGHCYWLFKWQLGDAADDS